MPDFLSPFPFIGITKNIALANESIWKEKPLFPQSCPKSLFHRKVKESRGRRTHCLHIHINNYSLPLVRRLKYSILHVRCLYFISAVLKKRANQNWNMLPGCWQKLLNKNNSLPLWWNKGFLIYCFHDIFFPLPLNVLASLQKKRKLLTDLVQDFRLTDLQQHIVTWIIGVRQ